MQFFALLAIANSKKFNAEYGQNYYTLRGESKEATCKQKIFELTS
jgi:hypothetical protein